ncbi:ribonuclease-III-like-domain-containing protein [Dipodascopsis uninucleata]
MRRSAQELLCQQTMLTATLLSKSSPIASLSLNTTIKSLRLRMSKDCFSRLNGARRTVVYMDGLLQRSTPSPSDGLSGPVSIEDTTAILPKIRDSWNKLTNNSEKYSLPDNVLCQVFTHKSYRHGVFPYNERLGFLGRKLFSLQSAIALVDYPSDNKQAIAAKGIERLRSRAAGKLLNSREPVMPVAESSGIIENIRWEPNPSVGHLSDPRASGLLTVASATVYAAIGAVALRHGGAVAESFIKEIILLGPHGVFSSSPDLTSETAAPKQEE